MSGHLHHLPLQLILESAAFVFVLSILLRALSTAFNALDGGRGVVLPFLVRVVFSSGFSLSLLLLARLSRGQVLGFFDFVQLLVVGQTTRGAGVLPSFQMRSLSHGVESLFRCRGIVLIQLIAMDV